MRNYAALPVVLFAGLSSLLLVSCAGVKCQVTASQIDQPVSFTPCIYDASGTVVNATGQDIRKHFKIKKWCWAMLWRNINLTNNTLDISEELRQQMTSVSGNAIVNLTLASESDCWWMLSSPLPVIPDYQIVTIEGDVVSVRHEKAQP